MAKREFEVEEVKGGKLAGKKKKYSVEEYGKFQEIGGLILGADWIDEAGIYNFYPFYFIQLPNAVKSKDKEYKLPGITHIIPTTYRILKQINKTSLIDDLIAGMKVIGEFHSHVNKVVGLSEKDIKALERRVNKRGHWVVGILTEKNNQRLRMSMKAFQKPGLKSKTNYNSIKRIQS